MPNQDRSATAVGSSIVSRSSGLAVNFERNEGNSARKKAGGDDKSNHAERPSEDLVSKPAALAKADLRPAPYPEKHELLIALSAALLEAEATVRWLDRDVPETASALQTAHRLRERLNHFSSMVQALPL